MAITARIGQDLTSYIQFIGLILAERNQPATSFPPDWVVFFHRQPVSYCTKPAQILFSSGWLCQIWAKWIWSWKLAGVLESLGPLLANTSKVIWIRCESDPVYLPGKWYGEGWLEAWWCCCCCLARGKCETVVGQLAAGPGERKPKLVTCACDKWQPLDESLCGKECTDDFFCYALCF